MSNNWDKQRQTEELATPYQRDGHIAQGHDRIHGDTPIGGISSPVAMSGDNDDAEFDITAPQKMVAAMSGSLLTSLLGMTDFRRRYEYILTYEYSHSS